MCIKKDTKSNITRRCGRRKCAHKNSEPCKANIYSINDTEEKQERLKTLIKSLKWDHLNEEEKKKVDDLVIYARSLSEHRRKYLLMADRLRKANLKLQPDKCEF